MLKENRLAVSRMVKVLLKLYKLIMLMRVWKVKKLLGLRHDKSLQILDFLSIFETFGEVKNEYWLTERVIL